MVSTGARIGFSRFTLLRTHTANISESYVALGLGAMFIPTSDDFMKQSTALTATSVWDVRLGVCLSPEPSPHEGLALLCSINQPQWRPAGLARTTSNTSTHTLLVAYELCTPLIRARTSAQPLLRIFSSEESRLDTPPLGRQALGD